MWRLEEKYNKIEQILVWSNQYSREYLEKMTMPEIRDIYNKLEFEILSKVIQQNMNGSLYQERKPILQEVLV